MNFDNSLTVALATTPLRHLLPRSRSHFAALARNGAIRFARATHLPVADGSAEVVYSSHMLEHLDREEARVFLGECHRVLRPGGVLRLAVPDLQMLVANYLSSGDADELISATLLGRRRPRGISARAKATIVGDREHMWMYDGPSLVRLVESAGFDEATVLPAGQTTIPEPGEVDLSERADESVYVEAKRGPLNVTR